MAIDARQERRIKAMISSVLIDNVSVIGAVNGAETEKEAVEGMKSTLKALGLSQEFERRGMHIIKAVVMDRENHIPKTVVNLIYGHD